MREEVREGVREGGREAASEVEQQMMGTTDCLTQCWSVRSLMSSCCCVAQTKPAEWSDLRTREKINGIYIDGMNNWIKLNIDHSWIF